MKAMNSGLSAWLVMQQLGRKWKGIINKMSYSWKKFTNDYCLGLKLTLTTIFMALVNIIVLLVVATSFSVGALVIASLALLNAFNVLVAALGAKVLNLLEILK